MIVVLDNIRSAHNVGSIFRTADAFGCEKLYLGGLTPGPLDRFHRPNTKVTKVSLGAEKTVAWEHIADTTKLLDHLTNDGYFIIALEQHRKSLPLKNIRHKHKKIALILGNEVEGLSPALLRRADIIAEIPMRGQKESLNVSVAFGIAAFSLQG